MQLYYFIKQISDLGLVVSMHQPSTHNLGALVLNIGNGSGTCQLFISHETMSDEMALDSYLTREIAHLFDDIRGY